MAASTKADFYVATDGDDAWSGKPPGPNAGKTDGPFASLVRARDAVRKLIAGGARDVTVLIRGGTYRLTETVVFSLADSAGDRHTITYAAFPGEKPILTSGSPVRGWRKVETAPDGLPKCAQSNVWVADVSKHSAMKPEPDGHSPRFFTLFKGDRELPRARGRGFSPTNSTPRQAMNGGHSAKP